MAREMRSNMDAWTSVALITRARAKNTAFFSGSSSPPHPLFTKDCMLSLSLCFVCMSSLTSEVGKLSVVICHVVSATSPSLCTPFTID